MTDPTFSISIDRTALSLVPFVMRGDQPTSLALLSYREPAMQSRVSYAPTSDYVHGDQALAWAWQQTLLLFTVAAREVWTEYDARAVVAELTAAITQWNFLVTVTVDDAAPEIWTCDPGSITAVDERGYVDLRDHDPAWAISIPCHPIRSVV